MADRQPKRTPVEIKHQVLTAWVQTMELKGSDGLGTGGLLGYLTSLDDTDRPQFIALGRGLLPVTPPQVNTHVGVGVQVSGSSALEHLLDEFTKVNERRRAAHPQGLLLDDPPAQLAAPPADQSEPRAGSTSPPLPADRPPPTHDIPVNQTFTADQAARTNIHALAAQQRQAEIDAQNRNSRPHVNNGAPGTLNLRPIFRDDRGVDHFEPDPP